MEDLILSALSVALEKLEKYVPLNKKKESFISLSDVHPLKLQEFMRENNVPEDAWFGGEENGYDGFSDIGLVWYVEVPTSEKERLDYKISGFERIAWFYVRDILLANGYSICSFDTFLLREFKGTNLYTMYTNGEFDRIFKFYSFRFKKV